MKIFILLKKKKMYMQQICYLKFTLIFWYLLKTRIIELKIITAFNIVNKDRTQDIPWDKWKQPKSNF